MRTFFLITLCSAFLLHAYCQGGRVFAGSEVFNYGIVDISINKGISWSTERSSHPGYFSLLQNADFIGYSNRANVDGYIKKIGNKSFVFPVGNGKNLRALEISQPNNITDSYATAWIEGDPTNNIDPTSPNAGMHPVDAISGLIVAVSKSGQWDWQVGENENLGKGTTGNGDGINVTVSIPDMTGFANQSELRLVGWNGLAWIDLSGKPTATGIIENSKLSGVMLRGISAIAVGRVLSNPIAKLKYSYAISSDCNTIIKWETIFESNPSTYIIEQSIDGFDFQPIASLPTIALSRGNIYSKQVDQQFGVAFYRLKILNSESGSYEYSTVFVFDNKCNEFEKMQIYPNPISDQDNVNISFITLYSGEGSLKVFNSIGQMVFNKSIQIKKGLNMLKPNFKNIQHGNFFIKITNPKGELICSIKQLIKQ
jgi:hypothetical protein